MLFTPTDKKKIFKRKVTNLNEGFATHNDSLTFYQEKRKRGREGGREGGKERKKKGKEKKEENRKKNHCSL